MISGLDETIISVVHRDLPSRVDVDLRQDLTILIHLCFGHTLTKDIVIVIDLKFTNGYTTIPGDQSRHSSSGIQTYSFFQSMI